MVTDGTPPIDDTEHSLVMRARDGDQDAFRELWCGVHQRVFGLCRHVTGDPTDARDAAQETQIAVWRHLRRFEGRAPFASWVLAIARNAARDVVRRRAGARELGLETAGDMADSQRLFADVVDELIDLRRALTRLPLNHREALLLWVGGLTYEQVAAIENVPVNTVKTWISRARAGLRAHLEP
jgi:RNA polymerase sigma-70 factor (ECF subfamily)